MNRDARRDGDGNERPVALGDSLEDGSPFGAVAGSSIVSEEKRSRHALAAAFSTLQPDTKRPDAVKRQAPTRNLEYGQ